MIAGLDTNNVLSVYLTRAEISKIAGSPLEGALVVSGKEAGALSIAFGKYQYGMARPAHAIIANDYSKPNGMKIALTLYKEDYKQLLQFNGLQCKYNIGGKNFSSGIAMFSTYDNNQNRLQEMNALKRRHEEIIQKNMDLYALMRKVVKTHPKKEQEFRRHVTARTVVDGKPVEISIDVVTEYYAVMKEFYDWIEKKIHE